MFPLPDSVVGKIRNGIVPLTGIAVVLAIVVYETAGAFPAANAEYIVSRLLALLAVSVLLSPFPALPLLYGWYSGNRAASVLAGILPLPLFFLAGTILFPQVDMAHPVSRTLPFVAVLAALLGLAGYCAAQRTKEYLAVSFVLAGLWLVFFLGGIN